MAQEGVTLRVDEIAVNATAGREAGVHVGAHGLYLLATNVARKHTAETVAELGGVDGLLAVEVAHHLVGMHTGVCAASAHNLCGAAQKKR